MKIPHTVLQGRTLHFSSYRNHKIKSKTAMSSSSWKKKEDIFCTTYLIQRNFFFYICVLSQCIVIEYTFRIYIRLHIKKHYFIHFRCLLLKSLKILSVPLTSKSTCLNLGLCLCSLRLRQFLVFIDFYFSCMFFGSIRSFPNL